VAKLTAEDMYEMMNGIIPDCNELAVTNAVYEICNDRLACDDAEGAAYGQADDATIAAFYAFMDLSGNGTHSARVFGYPDVDGALKTLSEAIEALPPETEEQMETTLEDISNFPSVFAAMVAWHREGEALRLVLYRHPQIPQARACSILKHTRQTVETERQERLARTSN
jgi:hypothetical protein